MMKKILSVIGITIPFVFGFAWFISLFLLDNIGVLNIMAGSTGIPYKKEYDSGDIILSAKQTTWQEIAKITTQKQSLT